MGQTANTQSFNSGMTPTAGINSPSFSTGLFDNTATTGTNVGNGNRFGENRSNNSSNANTNTNALDQLGQFQTPFQSTDPSQGIAPADMMDLLNGGPEEWSSPKGLSSSIQIMILLTVLSLAPSILLMTTCFVRIIVVLGLLRQAIGAQQLPPSQVITSLSIFMTILVMAPVWQEVKDEAIIPYTSQDGTTVSLEETINRGVRPLKRFMSRQIAMAENTDDIWLFFRYLPPEEQKNIPETWNDVPFKVLLPAYMISELKISFLIGFQVYLPFLVIDLVVSSIAISMGMMMLPPVIISLPFKLILFVLVDGWHLVVGMLMESFAPYS